MRLHVVLDLTRDDTPGRVSSETVMNELENEIENAGLEVDGAVYDVRVVGIGKTAATAAESVKLRAPR